MADVLVVEDDFSTRKNLVQLLQKSGYGVLAAKCGEEALDIMQKGTPKLIISDIMMPGIDGYELFKLVNREENEDYIPFIFLSARSEVSDIRYGMEHGADDYLTKPFTAHDLLRSVEIRLNREKRYLGKIEQFKNRVTRNLSHEFRTPLVPIIGYSQMIKENYRQLEPSEILEMAETINSSGSWMLKMIEKFLMLAELEENKNRNGKNIASIKEAVIKCSAQVTSALKCPEHLITNIEEANVNIPESELKIILNELLENAVKFSNPGSPIEISSKTEEDKCILTVSDFGKGMTPEQVDSLSSFMQFNRQGMHRAGLGLGLAIVNKIAEKNGIGVRIESQLGLFTKISLLFSL
ncbi:MAG: response regulator [Syntrophothermus sp.]